MANNPVSQAQKMRLAQMAANVDPAIRQYIQQQAVFSQKNVLGFPYYSTCRFSALKVGAGPFTYTLAANSIVTAFNYAIGNSMVQAGFAATFGNATDSETNLLTASQTRDNQTVDIIGIGIELCSAAGASDNSGVDVFCAQLARQLARNVSASLQLSGSITQLLGPISRFNAGCGLYGAAVDNTIAPDFDSVIPAGQPFGANGNPIGGTFYRFPTPIRWEASGGGKSDSSLTVAFTNRHPILIASADRAAGAGVTAFTAPPEIAVDLRTWLIGTQVGERSTNF